MHFACSHLYFQVPIESGIIKQSQTGQKITPTPRRALKADDFSSAQILLASIIISNSETGS